MSDPRPRHDPDDPYQPDPEIAELLAEQNGGTVSATFFTTSPQQRSEGGIQGEHLGGASRGRTYEEFGDCTEQTMFNLFGTDVMKIVHRTMGRVRGGKKKP